MIIIIFFILGLIIGSFLNVVIYRLNILDSVLGRSHCPNCKAKIRWYDNIPLLSFILLGAKCRDCEEKISWQYPMVELATGMLFALAAWKFFIFSDPTAWIMTIFSLFVVSCLIVIFTYDFLYMEIPSLILWIGIAGTVIFNIYFDWNLHNFTGGLFETKVYLGFLGAILGSIMFFAIAYFSKEKMMGMGDGYLAIFLGLFLGFPQIFYTLMIGFSIGAFWGIGLIILGKKGMKSQVPLGPFLIMGTFIMMFFSEKILSWCYYLFF